MRLGGAISGAVRPRPFHQSTVTTTVAPQHGYFCCLCGLQVRLLSALALADSGPVVPDQARPVDLCKPLVVYGQYLFIIININSVPYPATLSQPIQFVGWFWSSASSNSLGLDCVLPRNAALPVAMQKTLFSLLMPVAMLLVLLLLDALWLLVLRKCATRRRQRQAVSMRDRFLSLSLCISFLFLPTWAHAVFSLFTCVPLDVPVDPPYAADAVGSFLAQDMSERCYAPGGYHRSYALGLGLPLLILICFVLPAGLFVFIWLSNRRGLLVDDSFRKQYGFLYRSWRVCWWESVVVVQTTILVMIGTFGYALGVYFQLLVMMAALGIIGVLLFLIHPHNSKVAASVTLCSIAVLVTTAFSCLTFLSYRNITPAYGYTMAMGVFVLVINVVFVLSTVWRLLRLLQCGDRLRRLFGCCFARFAPWCCELCRHPTRPSCIDAWHLPWLHGHDAASSAAAAAAPCTPCCSFKLHPAAPPVESKDGVASGIVHSGHAQKHLQQPPAAACDAA